MTASKKPGRTDYNYTDREIGLIGGGITGLFIGYFLVRKGFKIVLFERDQYAGGALSTFPIIKDKVVEKFYHHILSYNKNLLSFLEEAGFSESLIRNNCSVGIIKDGKISPIDSMRQIGFLKDMTFPTLLKSCWLGINILLRPSSTHWDNITAEELITNYCGAKFWQQMCYPMIRSKFGNRYSDISGLWLVNKLRQKIRIHKENAGEKLIYMKGSFQQVIDYLEKYILESGSRIEYRTTVENILTANNRVGGLRANGKTYSFNTIISTVAQPQFIRITSEYHHSGISVTDIPGNQPENPGDQISNFIDSIPNTFDPIPEPIDQIVGFREKFGVTEDYLSFTGAPFSDIANKPDDSGSRPVEGISYSHSLCTVLRLKKNVSEFYWLYNLDEKIPFAAIIEHTNLTGTEMYDGESIMYIARYLDSKDDLYSVTDEAIIEEYIPWLNKIFPGFNKKDIINSFVFRHPYAQPIFDKGYLDKKPPHESSINGLYSVNMSQLFPQERTLDGCFSLAKDFTGRF